MNDNPNKSATSGSDYSASRPVKVAESVARQILEDVIELGHKPGTKLPVESEMVKTYGVARASLREALRILEIHGLVRIKPGPDGGPVVADITSKDIAQTLAFFFRASKVTFKEVMEARLILEPVMARQAAERRNPEIQTALRNSIDRSRAGLESHETDDEYRQTAAGFHEIITGTTGNSVLDLLTGSLKEIYSARFHSFVYTSDERKKLVDDHERVAEAIISGNCAQAEALMRAHMEDWISLFSERFPDFLNEPINWF